MGPGLGMGWGSPGGLIGGPGSGVGIGSGKGGTGRGSCGGMVIVCLLSLEKILLPRSADVHHLHLPGAVNADSSDVVPGLVAAVDLGLTDPLAERFRRAIPSSCATLPIATHSDSC